MLEKSSYQKKWSTSVRPVTSNLRKHDDYIVTIGVSLVIVMLFKIACIICFVQ